MLEIISKRGDDKVKQKRLLTIILSIFVLLFAACSKNDENNDNEVEPNNEPEIENEENEENEEEENEEENEENEEVGQSSSDGEIDFTSLLEDVEENTEGETKVVHESHEQQVHEEEAYSISLDAYVIAEIKDFHANFSIPFNSDDEGAVLISHFTIENKADHEIAYTPNVDLQYSGADRFPGPNRDLIPLDSQLSNQLNSDNSFVIDEGETVTGYVAMALRTVDLENINNVGFAEIHAPEAGDEYEADEYSYKNKLGKKATFKISVSEEGAEKQQANEQFYPDRTMRDNMGEKTMIKEKADINESKSLGNSTVTLEGYQFTECEPNEHEAPRFESFDTGIVLQNVKLSIENNEDEDISLSDQKTKLTMNNGKQYTLYELMLSHYSMDDVIESGASGEAYVVFILDKEQYEKIWKDKPFELEYGPFYSTDIKDISKGKKVEFVLPE